MSLLELGRRPWMNSAPSSMAFVGFADGVDVSADVVLGSRGRG